MTAEFTPFSEFAFIQTSVDGLGCAQCAAWTVRGGGAVRRQRCPVQHVPTCLPLQAPTATETSINKAPSPV